VVYWDRNKRGQGVGRTIGITIISSISVIDHYIFIVFDIVIVIGIFRKFT